MPRFAQRPRFSPATAAAALAWLLVWAWLGRAPLQGQVGSGPPATGDGAEADRYTLSGTVVNSATGEPIRRVLVECSLDSTQAMLTDGEGRFEFDGLPEGQASINVRKPGFFREQDLHQGQLRSPTPATMIEIGPRMSPVVLTLYPEGVITGRVEADGEPVDGMPVSIFSLQVASGRKRWTKSAATSTDEDGDFRFAELTPGAYYVTAGPQWNHGAPAGSRTKREEGFSEVFYPDAASIEAATPLEIAPGQQAEADLSLKAEPLFEVSGTIVGMPSTPPTNVQLGSRSGEGFAPTKIDRSTGKFQFQVPAGSYTLAAHTQNADGSTLNGELPLTVATDLPGIRLTLGPGNSMPVSARIEYVNRPAEGEAIAGDAQVVNVRLSSSTTGVGSLDYYAASANAKGHGLVVRDLEPGTYFAEITSSYGGWYVASAVSGPTDLLSDDLTVLPGAPLQPLEIVLRNDPATLTGTVSSEGHDQSGAVLLLPRHGQPKVEFTHQGNEFQFTQLAPGEYEVLAFDRVDGVEYTNPESLKAYLVQASHVTLLSNGKASVNLELIHVGQ
jgi:hypothetical protein